MIRIFRPEQAPAVLLRAGKEKTRLNCESYDQNEEAYRSGSEKFKFDRNTYAHKTVKNALLRAQHRKCCYCESKFRVNSPGAVEHFRPKGAVKKKSDTAKHYPGYYWLAYSWRNLLVSCETCNTSYKGSLFPLVDEDTRSQSHRDHVEEEIQTFIDPSCENPECHIRFRGAEVEHLTERGLKTIQGLGLRRGELEDARAEVLEPLEILNSIIQSAGGKVEPSKVSRARDLLKKATRPEAQYSAMMRNFLNFSCTD